MPNVKMCICNEPLLEPPVLSLVSPRVHVHTRIQPTKQRGFLLPNFVLHKMFLRDEGRDKEGAVQAGTRLQALTASAGQLVNVTLAQGIALYCREDGWGWGAGGGN